MKFFPLLFLCLFFVSNVCAQTVNADDPKPVCVEEIALYRDDGEGKAGDETDHFLTADKTVHVRVLLDSQAPALVKMQLSAVEAKGLKNGAKIVTANYKTNGSQNIVLFRASPENVWLPGKYRVDVLVDGKLSAGREFEIKLSPEIKKQAPQPPNRKSGKPRKSIL